MVKSSLGSLERPISLQLGATAKLLKPARGMIYRFSLKQRSSLTLEVPQVQSALGRTLSLSIRSRSGQLVARSTLGQGRASLNLELTANTYFLRVERRNGQAVYRLRASATPLVSNPPLSTDAPLAPDIGGGSGQPLEAVANPAADSTPMPSVYLRPSFSFTKVSTDLASLYGQFLTHLQAGNPASSFRADNSLIQVADGRVIIEAVATSDAALLQSDLSALGLERSAQVGLMVSGAVPISALNELDSVASLQFIRAAMPIRTAGPN